MSTVALRALGVLLLVAAAAFFAGPPLGDLLATGQPPPKPAAQAPAPSGPAPAAAPSYTQQDLDEWIGEAHSALWLMWGVKILLALLGVAFLVREYLRMDGERHGLLPPNARGAPTAVDTPLGALGLAVIFPLGIQVLLVALFPPNRPRPVGALEFGVIVAVASFLPPALITVLRRWRLGGGSLPRPAEAVVHGLAFACIATLIVLPIQIGWGLALHGHGVELKVQDVVTKFARPDAAHQPWLLAAFGVLVAPFTEEAVFRGLLYPALRSRLPGGPFGAAVAVSLLFALIHANLVAFVPLFALAMVLAWTMERTNSLLACVVVHAVHNASSVLPLLVRHVEGS